MYVKQGSQQEFCLCNTKCAAYGLHAGLVENEACDVMLQINQWSDWGETSWNPVLRFLAIQESNTIFLIGLSLFSHQSFASNSTVHLIDLQDWFLLSTAVKWLESQTLVCFFTHSSLHICFNLELKYRVSQHKKQKPRKHSKEQV